MHKIVYFCAVFCLLTSFGYREPHYCKLSDRIVSSYNKEFAEPRNLNLTGYAGCSGEKDLIAA